MPTRSVVIDDVGAMRDSIQRGMMFNIIDGYMGQKADLLPATMNPYFPYILERRIRHMVEAPGIWLDYLNRNSRITENVFHDIYSLHAAIYLEVSHAPNVIDHNLIWDVRKPLLNRGMFS